MTTAPHLETARLVLRAHRADDHDACAAVWADPQVVRHIGTGRPSTPQQTWMRMLAYAGHWSLQGFGYWAIEDRATGAYLGDVGFADFRRGIRADLAGVPELGYVIASDAAGRGIATEAVRAVCAWGDAVFAGSQTIALVDDANVASQAVARKAGYVVVDRLQLDGVVGMTQLFARDRPQAAEAERA